MSTDSKSGSRGSILILKTIPLALQSTEQFLRSRGWTLYSSVNLTDALQLLFDKKIEYFIICANHPHKKVKSFPKLLSQFSGLKLISYVDVANTLNMAKLQELGLPYQILPPLSGPAIERTVFRMEKDLESQRNLSEQESDFANFLQSARDPAKLAKTRAKFQDYLSNENDEMIPDADPSEIETFAQKKEESFSEWEERTKKKPSSSFILETEEKYDDETSYTYLNNKAQDEAEFQQELNFQIQVENALETTMNHGNSLDIVEAVKVAQNCICLSVESESISGYLVAAMGKDRRFDDELLANLQSKLLNLIANDDLAISDKNILEVKLRPVEFQSWALEKAKFLKKSIHNGNEVAMAFFPANKPGPTMGTSKAVDMVSISIDDLASDVPVTFDVYIHLPANNKYILYTPKGRFFMQNQKDRLKDKGVDQMHIKKTAVEDIKKYHVQNLLNNSIEDFIQKTQIPKKKVD